MRVIPGTHKSRELLTHESSKDTPNVLGNAIAEKVDESAAVDIVLRAGDVSLHDPFIIHGSDANTSEKRRGGLTLRYIPTTTRIMMDDFPAYLCRGEAVPGINNYPPLPKFRSGDHYPFRGCDQPPWV